MIYITKSRNYVLEQLIDWRGQQRAALTNSELDQSPGETGGTQGIRRMNKQQFAIWGAEGGRDEGTSMC